MRVQPHKSALENPHCALEHAKSPALPDPNRPAPPDPTRPAPPRLEPPSHPDCGTETGLRGGDDFETELLVEAAGGPRHHLEE
jgi:hypothetical protein